MEVKDQVEVSEALEPHVPFAARNDRARCMSWELDQGEPSSFQVILRPRLILMLILISLACGSLIWMRSKPWLLALNTNR